MNRRKSLKSEMETRYVSEGTADGFGSLAHGEMHESPEVVEIKWKPVEDPPRRKT